MKNIVSSIIICEETTEDFRPVRQTDRFTQHNHSVTVLVQLQQVKEATIRFHWYINSDRNNPVAVYDIPLDYSENKIRLVTNTLGIQYLFNEEQLNIFQPWFVLVELDRELYITKFEIYESNEYNHLDHSTPISLQPAYDFKV